MTDLERLLKRAKDATADAGASSEHSETDLERMLRIAHEDKKQYTRSGAYRRNALQNRTESFMDIVTQGETAARAGIDRYKANRDADYYQQMNKAGATYRDQDMINRSVTGYKGAYDLWKSAFDREKDAAADRTRREREMTENPAKAPTVSDIVSRYSGKTKTLADLGNNVRGAIDAYKRQSDAAKTAPTPEEARQQAEESVQYWQNVAREAARYGDVYRQATAKKHLADSVENYSRATKGYFDNLKNTDPGTYYALTMTPEEIDRELELLNNGAYLDSKITNSLTNDERIMGEYWHRTPQEQRQYEHNLERARFAGETDDERNAYISSEKEAYRDARNRMLNDASVEGSVGSNQEPYNRREEITQANEARKSVLENARLTQKVIQADREGITNDPQIIASGKQKFEKDQDAIWDRWTVEQGWAETSPKMDNLGRAHEHGYVLDRMDEMTEEQRARIYSLYDRDPETALKLAQTYVKALDDKVYQEIFDWVAKDSGWQFGRRAVGNLAGALANLASGLDPFGYGGQSAGKVGDALIGGAAQSATRNGWFGIEELGGDQSWIDSSVPFIGRGRAGEASQLVSSMEQSALTTLPAMVAGRYDAAAASLLETAGLLLQSSSAARSDYRESIEAGLDDTTAKIHAVAAGIAEYTFEKVSFDKLLAQNTSRMTFKKVMKDVLVQAGIEGSEELHTTLANTIMDEIISGDGKSKVDRRIAELVQGGMSMKEAKGVAEKEWLTGIVNDFIGGAASGGIMTGAHYAVGATVNTAENKIANNAVNQLVGQYAGAQTENFTDADTIEAAKNYAEARGIDASGLTEAAAQARNASVDEAMSALRGSTQSETETKSISKRDSRKAGKAWTEIRTQISQDFDGKSGAQAAQLYDQMAEQYGAGIKTIVDEVVTTQARQSYLEQSQTAQELQQKVKPQVEALPEGGYKQASMRAYDQAEYQLRQQEAAKTADRLAKAGNIDTEVTYTNKDGSETTAQIADLSDDLTSVVLDNGETVPIKDVQMSADTASAIRIFSRIAGKKAASLAFREYRAYLNNGGTEGYRFAEAVATAYGQGLNGVLTPEQALKMAPDFAQEAAQRAFNAGRQKHQANIENEQARRKAAEEKAKAEGAQTVKGELRGEGSIKWEKMNATRRTRAQNQIKYLDSIAQGIGVDIELFQSEATRRGKRMAYRGEQGAWYVDKATGKPVIRIDVNAGANFISDLNAALIATTGHELAHHFQHISPAVYDEYRQAVVQAILSTENGYEKLQRLIEHEKRINRRADGTTISTDEAIDEVVADASRDRVGDRNLWKNVADSMSDESRGKVAQWLHDRFSKILKLTKRYAGFEAADLVLQSAQEYQDLIGELWEKLTTQAANAVDVRESDYEAGVQAKENPSGEKNSTQRNAARSVEETDAEYMDAVKRGDMETAQRMVDEAAERSFANSKIRKNDGKLRKLFHGTNSGSFTVFDKDLIGTAREGDVGFFGRGFYFSFHEGEARMYGRDVIEAYLNIENPFNYLKELGKYDGKRVNDYYGSRMVFAVNFAKKFPELATKHFVTAWDKTTGERIQLTLKEFSDIFESVYNDKVFKVESLKTWDGTEWLVTADMREESYTDENGNKHTWPEYGFEQRFYSETDAKNKLFQVSEYLQRTMFDGLEVPASTDIIQETDFTEALKSRGFDGVIQSEEGDEVVAFESSQIKSADPVTYDDDGNVIPLSERFNPENKDIRYSEREDQSLRGRVSELEDQLDMAELNGLSQAEIRKLNNELIKARGQLDNYTTNQRRQAKKTSFNEILRNLENYERIDLESLAEQISDSAWDDYDELSDEELIDALRETINERLDDFAPGDADNPKYGLFVKKPKTAGNISVVRYSDRDTEYLEAVESNEDWKVEKMVRDAAVQWGAATDERGKPIPLYHGTPRFGFTVFKDPAHEVPFIYTSTNPTVSAHYAGDKNYAGRRPIGRKYRTGTKTEDIIENAKWVYESNFHVMSTEEKLKAYKEIEKQVIEIADKLDEVHIGAWNAESEAFKNMPDEVANAISWVEDMFWTIRDSDYKFNFDGKEDYPGERAEFFKVLDSDIENAKTQRAIVQEFYDENRKNLSKREKAFLSYLLSYEVGDAAIDIEYKLRRVATENDVIMNEAGNINNPLDLKESMDMYHETGAYTLYGNLGDNPFIFDANGAQFWGVKVPEMGDGYYSTDSISKWAYENGYTGVVMKNIYDYGDKADNYVFFNSSQLKSADPVTYDDSGNVIPLSERFNEENQDIRYSERDNPVDVDEKRNEPLTGQIGMFGQDGQNEAWTQPNLFDQTEQKKAKTGEELFLEEMDKFKKKLKKDGVWYGKEFDKFYAENPQMNFVERFYRNDPKTKADMGRFVAAIDDPKLLSDLSWYTTQSPMLKKGNYRGAVTKTRNVYKARINEIMAEKNNGHEIKLEHRKYSFDEVRGIFNKLNTNEAVGKLADKVFPVAKKLGLDIYATNKWFGERDAHAAGAYRGMDVFLRINAFADKGQSDQHKATTILHEMIHACTVYAIDEYMRGGYSRTINQNILKAVEMLEKVYGQARGEIPINAYYGMKNLKEFVAELANPKFREELSKHNLFERVLDAIKRFFGIDRVKGPSYLDSASAALDYLLDEIDYGEAASYFVKAENEAMLWERTTGESRYSERDISEIQDEYEEALADGNPDWQKQLVAEAAYNAGYRTGAYHGSPQTDITEFNTRSENTKKEKLQLLFGTHFTQDRRYAEIYAKKARNSKGTSRMTTKTGRVYDVWLDLGKSLDLQTAKNYTPGTEMYQLYDDLPDRVKKRVPALKFTEREIEMGLGTGTYVNTGTIEKALQAMTPKEATDFLVGHGYNSVLYLADYSTGMANNRGTRDPSIIMLDPERIKSADPITRSQDGNIIPLTERFNPAKKDIRYSQRDYGQVSDLDVVESLDEKKATTPEAKALIREAKEKAEKIRKLEQKLSELRGELKTTDRALNTRGITKLSSDMLKRMSMSNDYYENLSGWLSGKITEVYQNALDQMDRTGSVRAAGDALYNGAQEIADFLMQNAGYHENIGGKWQRARWASQFTQNEEQRQAVMNDVFASLIRDWSENRNRAPMHETEADRIAQRATRPVQKKLDETRAKLETASAENAELAEKNASLTRDYESSRDYAGYLRDYAKSLRNQLNDAEKAVKLAGKTTQKQEQKIADLKRKLHDALQAKKAMENAKQRAERAGERTASRLQRQLEAQIEREQRIMEGKLKPLAIQRMIAEARDTATAKARAQAQERFANQKENRKRGELRARIINLADEIQRTATRPTESKYVPASLYGAMSETLGMVSDLLESDNTKGAAKRLNIGQKILELKNEYEKIKSLDDAAIKSEYDEDISMHLGEIETVLRRVGLEPGKSYHGMTLRDLPTQTLQDLYDEISAIYKSMRDARKALAGGRAVDISTIQNSIIEQQAGIDSLNEIGKIGKLARNSMLDGLSTMRAVEMMSGWDRNAALYKAVSRIEDGAAEAARWSMNYNKRMQPLKTGKNELTYRNALTKRLDWQNAKDMNSGKPVKMTKLQALQIYMSWLREESDPRVQHLHEGGTATIRDARDVLAGKASRAASNDIRVTPELMQEIKQSLTEWDQQYMDAIHEYMTEEGEATNKIHYQVKHKVLKTSENYFPEMVNKDYVDAKLEETAADNLWVMAPGATNELRPGAKQPVIIDGTETVMAAHVRDMANYIGLALPIRDFAKVLNGKVATGEAYATTIRSSISPNFGQKGIDVLKHAAMDVQGGRKVERKTQIERYLNGLHGAFVRSTLLINPSVTIKQAASYAAIESILSYRAVVAGNRPIFSGSDNSHSTSLIAQIFMAPDSKTAQRIYDEIDEHTALHYQRRQGMSYEELAHEALRQSGWKTTKANLGARMEQNAVGRIVRKTGARLSPVQWIQRMDVATTAAIWVACKTQSKIDGFEAGTQEFWNHTTQLYERCLRETQPMYDPLHRSERQKGGGLMQYLFPFRTVPFQNHGQIVASFEAMKAAKGTSRAKEATRFFRKTVVAQVKSAIVFSALSMLAAGLRHKPDEYMDENGEVDIGAMLGKLGIDTASTLFSVIFPLTGSETWEFGESQVNKFIGKDGKQWDIFSVGAVEMLNDMFKAAGNVVGDAAKAMHGEKVTKDSFKNHVTKLLLETSAVLGIPLENIKKYSEGIVKDVGEILDGKIPAFNNDAIDRGTSTNIDRYLKAWSAGDEKKRKAVLEELRGNLSASGKDEKQVNQAIRTAMNKEVKTKVVGGSWTPEKAAEFLRGTGAYSDDQINSTLVDWIKTRFEQGKLTEAEAIEAIMPYTPKKNDAERWDTVRGWAARLEHEDDEEYAWKKYEELTAAVEGREEIGGILDEYRAHGYTDKQLNDAVKGGIRAALTGGSITENEAIDLLTRYVTYTKDGQAVAFDKDKAWKTVQEWQAKAENDGDPDYSYNQYDELFSAIDANKDVNGIVSELTAHGYDKDDVTKAVKGHLIDNYVAGKASETALKNQLSRYCGIVKTDEVSEIVNSANCKKATGYYPDSLKDGYVDGKLSKDNVISALKVYKGLDSTSASNRVRAWDFQKEHPDLKWDSDRVDAYYDKRPEGGGKSAYEAGISVETYDDYRNRSAKAKGTDKDGDGRTDSGSKKAEILRIIDSLDLSRSQKDALYYINGWAASTIYEAPWH